MKILQIYYVSATKILPVPLYTFTKPSPETAEPSMDFEDISTVNCKEADQAIAIFPSIYTSTF